MIYVIATIVFIIAQAFFSGIETGLISIQKPRVQLGLKNDVRGARILNFFLNHPTLMLSTCLLGTNISVVCASVMAKKSATFLGYGTGTGFLATTAIMTLALLAAEIIPKNWFRQLPYQRCLLCADVLQASYLVLRIPARLLARFTDAVSAMFAGKGNADADARTLMREDFRLLLRESESAGIVGGEEADILDRSIDFHTATIGEIQRDVESTLDLSSSTTIADAVSFCGRHDVSRLPVHLPLNENRSTKQWLGVFSVYDAIFTIDESLWANTQIGACLRPLTSIPADADLNEVLKRAKRTHSQSPLLAVTDATGKQVGIVTPMDVVAKIFGEQ